MTLRKAIEILGDLRRGTYEGDKADAQAAERLGTEALERITRRRATGYGINWLAELPSESKD